MSPHLEKVEMIMHIIVMIITTVIVTVIIIVTIVITMTKILINNGNRANWGAVWPDFKIKEARRGSLRQSNISDQNCTTQSSITTVIHLFCNRKILLLIVF